MIFHVNVLKFVNGWVVGNGVEENKYVRVIFCLLTMLLCAPGLDRVPGCGLMTYGHRGEMAA